ncbi:hypothetical protein [Azospirillum melinis]
MKMPEHEDAGFCEERPRRPASPGAPQASIRREPLTSA